jgi:NlpC/P60 family putative phage cell wall peptidase
VIPPPYTCDWGEAGSEEVLPEAARGFLLEIPIADAGPGALIIFRMARNDPAKHYGVRSAAGLIHAYKRAGVVEGPWSPIWARKAAFAFLYGLTTASSCSTPSASSLQMHATLG